MVIGYDTYHDKGTKGASVGAVVSSLNQQWTKYLSQAARHSNQEELTDNFALGVRSRCWVLQSPVCVCVLLMMYFTMCLYFLPQKF